MSMGVVKRRDVVSLSMELIRLVQDIENTPSMLQFTAKIGWRDLRNLAQELHDEIDPTASQKQPVLKPPAPLQEQALRQLLHIGIELEGIGERLIGLAGQMDGGREALRPKGPLVWDVPAEIDGLVVSERPQVGDGRQFRVGEYTITISGAALAAGCNIETELRAQLAELEKTE